MKPVFVILFVVFLTLSNAIPSKKQKGKSAKNKEGSDGELGSQEPGDWPSPGSVSDFSVPAGFTDNNDTTESNGGETTDGHDEHSSGKHHGKSSHKGHRN